MSSELGAFLWRARLSCADAPAAGRLPAFVGRESSITTAVAALTAADRSGRGGDRVRQQQNGVAADREAVLHGRRSLLAPVLCCGPYGPVGKVRPRHR